MNILITDPTNNLRRFIPQTSIAHIEFLEEFARVELAQHIDGQTKFFTVGNSRVRLAHAVELGADVVYLYEFQFLNERQFREWSQQPQNELAGLLEASEIVEVG